VLFSRTPEAAAGYAQDVPGISSKKIPEILKKAIDFFFRGGNIIIKKPTKAP